jgi:hypothetical protein
MQPRRPARPNHRRRSASKFRQRCSCARRRGDRMKHQLVHSVFCIARVRYWQILLQKSLMACARSDSLVQMRFAAEAGDDGTSQSRPKAAVLFI